MNKLYEYLDTVHSPYEAFVMETASSFFPVRKHWHYFIELLYVKKGQIEAVCDGKWYSLHVGDLLVCHSQAIHEFLPSRDPATGEIIPGQYLVIQCDLNALNTNSNYVPKFRYIFQAARQMSECKVVLSREDMQDIDVEPLFWACIRERHTRDYGFTVLLNGFISDLLIQIIRVWRRNGLDPQNLPFGKPEDKELSMIAEYIDAHSNQAIRVQDLAEMCNMSYSYFAKNFRDYYGMSCKEYIEYVRMNKAEELVLFTDYDLNYICQEIGYFDCSHFIKEYKKHKGVTPKQHRMRMRKQKGEEVLNYFDENDLIQKNEE